MIGISKHILLNNNDIFKEFKKSITEQLQNGLVDWWWRESYSAMSSHKKISKQKVWKCTEKNMFHQFVSEHHLWQITETKITDSSIWILRDIKNFWKFQKWQGVKNLTSVGGRKYRFCTPAGCTKSTWWWNLPTLLLIFKIVALTKILNFRMMENP